MGDKIRRAMGFYILFALAAVIMVNLAPSITIIGQASAVKSDQWCYSISSEAEESPSADAAASQLPRNLHAQCFPTEFECQQALESDSNAASGQENCEHLALVNPDDDGSVDEGADNGQGHNATSNANLGAVTAGG